MKKRKFGTGGLNALDATRDQSGASLSAPPQVIQAPQSPPGQTPLYPAPTATFPRAQFKKGGKVVKFGKGGTYVGRMLGQDPRDKSTYKLNKKDKSWDKDEAKIGDDINKRDQAD